MLHPSTTCVKDLHVYKISLEELHIVCDLEWQSSPSLPYISMVHCELHPYATICESDQASQECSGNVLQHEEWLQKTALIAATHCCLLMGADTYRLALATRSSSSFFLMAYLHTQPPNERRSESKVRSWQRP